MFGFLLPLPLVGGLGARVAIFVLILYALLPIIRTTVSGIRSVDRVVVEAATALGMTERQFLWQVRVAACASVDCRGHPRGFGDWRRDRDDSGGCRRRRARRVHLPRALDGRSHGHSRRSRAGRGAGARGRRHVALGRAQLLAAPPATDDRVRPCGGRLPDPPGRRGERGHARAPGRRAGRVQELHGADRPWRDPGADHRGSRPRSSRTPAEPGRHVHLRSRRARAATSTSTSSTPARPTPPSSRTRWKPIRRACSLGCAIDMPKSG